MIDIVEIKKNLELLEKEPLNSKANYLIASYLAHTGRLNEVYPFISKVIESGERIQGAHLILGKYLWEQENRFSEAREEFETELKKFPESKLAIANLSLALAKMGEMTKAVELHKKYLAEEPSSIACWNLLLMHAHYDPESSNDELLTYANEYSQTIYPNSNNSLELFDKQDLTPFKPRLKVGFVSGDFKSHSVIFFIKDLLLELNRFADVYCYCNNKHDNLTTLLKMEVRRWRDVDKLSDNELTEKIRSDKIDILVDLSGNTALNRLGVFAMRAAPVQVSWLGQAGPLGIKNMDYMLCNSDIVLDDEDKYYMEKPFRLDSVYAPFTPPQEEIMVEEAPCIKNGFVTFGCFNNFMKINHKTLQVWIEILKQVPNSRIYLKNEMLKDPIFKQALENDFVKAGIDKNRLILEEYVHNKKTYIVEYNNIDIALDSFPLCGGTTTNDLLWMGVPLITLSGERMSQRISASTLKRIGAEELISYSKEEYINKAVSLSKDFNKIDRYKRTLRDKYLGSEICDKEKFARNLLRAFSVMWYETVAKAS